MSKNTDSEISHNLKIRFDVNYIYVNNSYSYLSETFIFPI
jgi:hypothetical protein